MEWCCAWYQYAPGNPALQEIKEEFGSDVVSDDGTIDRKALGGIVFSDPSQMKVSPSNMIMRLNWLVSV